MSFDPITGIWAANKAAEMVGGSGGSSGSGTHYLNLADYVSADLIDSLLAGETIHGDDAPLTDEQQSEILAAFYDRDFNGFYVDMNGLVVKFNPAAFGVFFGAEDGKGVANGFFYALDFVNVDKLHIYEIQVQNNMIGIGKVTP